MLSDSLKCYFSTTLCSLKATVHASDLIRSASLVVHNEVPFLALVVPNCVIMTTVAIVALPICVPAASAVTSAVATVSAPLASSLSVFPTAPIITIVTTVVSASVRPMVVPSHLNTKAVTAEGDAISIANGVLSVTRVRKGHKC